MESDDPLPRAPRSSPLTPNKLEPEKDFIQIFESLPELWDPENPHYTNKYKRIEKLTTLVPVLRKLKPNATINDVKRKINTIRSNHRREFKKVLASIPDEGPIYTPKIWYYPYLHFLRKLEKFDYVESEQTKQELAELQGNPFHITKEYLEIQEECPHTEGRPRIQSQKIKKENAQKRSYDEIDESTNQNSSLQLQNPCVHTCKRSKISNIALEWSETLDRLDTMQRLFAKKAINDILFEAELGNLQKDSVKINISESVNCACKISQGNTAANRSALPQSDIKQNYLEESK